MSNAVVAYRYAKALIDLSIEQKVLNEVNADMKLFQSVAEENKEFMSVMANPIVRQDKKNKILKNIFEKNVHPVTFSIFKVLTKKNRESLILSISKEFQKLYNEINNIKHAIVTTVDDINATQRNEFLKILKDATGKDIELEERTDKSLIGGYILKIGDTQVDTSVKKRINDLKLSMA
ncbi:ATP synthase F1 subunit delta [Marinilongibacter aquaticus]|uniref:ATP synthase F1 subunit delta n=1 Tax=Marinilongibacter aquaticus TaxID=2975157 RepID=UPI0021BDE543|nr:ATP synthase F1 subunit delta [Marinilongibacter aquaticus]UBM60462.1 ATP synthase F1 subunit delta [Marinilongibacter aquaticus]